MRPHLGTHVSAPLFPPRFGDGANCACWLEAEAGISMQETLTTIASWKDSGANRFTARQAISTNRQPQWVITDGRPYLRFEAGANKEKYLYITADQPSGMNQVFIVLKADSVVLGTQYVAGDGALLGQFMFKLTGLDGGTWTLPVGSTAVHYRDGVQSTLLGDTNKHLIEYLADDNGGTLYSIGNATDVVNTPFVGRIALLGGFYEPLATHERKQLYHYIYRKYGINGTVR